MTENKRRQLLKKATITGLLLIIMAFLYIIFKGLLWSPKLSQEESYQTLALGETRLVRYQQQRYWVTKLNNEQREQLSQLVKFIHISSGCSIQDNVCELDARSERSGVLVQFVSQRPAQLPSNTPWFGGFVDPASGSVYDLLGRGYLSNRIKTPPGLIVR